MYVYYKSATFDLNTDNVKKVISLPIRYGMLAVAPPLSDRAFFSAKSYYSILV